ncbi:AAA family ATPase [Sphaerisporangium dianthi]|uniref:Nuclease SbcCD subunit C n=1 Tax=Sphaerisporangium dianthi TaxID=1436120 RepID=A0ABV9CG38_9ACTN
MRLHRLRLTAFGSFPGEEEVDFDALGEAGLFLVHGPTGAGKTTVLDAVCYALYGQVPGQRNSARRLRCDHAPADRGPKVVLDVTLRGRRFRLTRSPVWHRPKLRGEGLIEEKAKVLLEEVPPSGERVFLSSRADETGELIGGLLGMNADQFCQVAMLPQGDFARFLRADGEERRKLLEKLFSVKIYSDVERWLSDHRTAAGHERQESRQRVDSAVDHMRGAAGPALLALLTPADVPPSAPPPHAATAPPSDAGLLLPGDAAPSDAGLGALLPPGGVAPPPDVAGFAAAPDAKEEPLQWARALLAVAREAYESEAQAQVAGEAALRSARAELDAARELAQRQRVHAEAVARRDDLDRTADERSDLESILADAARADAVLPLVQQAEQRAEAAAKAEGLAADAVARALPLTGRPSTVHTPGAGPPHAPKAAETSSHGGGGPRVTRSFEAGGGDPCDPRSFETGGGDPRVSRSSEAGGGTPRVTQSYEAGGGDLRASQSSEAHARGAASHPVEPSTPERLAELAQARRDEIVRLEQLRPEEARLARLRERLAQSAKRLATLAAQEAEAVERLAILPESRRQTGERLAQARLAASGLPAARAAVTAATGDLEAVRRRDALAGHLAAAVRDLLGAIAALPAALSTSDPANPSGATGTPELSGTSETADPSGTSETTDPSGASETADPSGTSGTSGFSGASGAPEAEAPAFPLSAALAEVAREASSGGRRAYDPARAEAIVREVRDRLAALERAHRDELAGLELRRAEETRFEETRVRLHTLDALLAELAERETALADARAELPARLQEALGRLEAVRAEAALIPAATSACQKAATLLEQASRRDALTVELETAEGERRRATDEAQESRDRLQAVRQARIDGMAAELARGLVPGEPCVVCGSADHPVPASPALSTPAVDDERAAQALSDAAQEVRQAAEGRVAVLSAQLEDATLRAEGLPAEVARAARDEAEAELARLHLAAEQAPAAETRAQSLQDELDAATSQARELDVLIAEQRANQAGLRQELDHLAEVLDAARGGDDTVGARRDRVTAETRLLTVAVRAAARAGETVAAWAEARAAVLRTWSGREGGAAGPGDAVVAEEEPTLARAEEALREAEAALVRLREVAHGEAALVEAVARIEAEITELSEIATRAGLEIAAERAAETGAAADAELLAARLAEARGEDATLAARLDRLAEEAGLLRDAVDAARLAEAESAERDAAAARAESAAVKAGFAGLADVRAAARPATARESMAERLRELHAERAAVVKLLTDPALAAAAAAPAAALHVLADAHDRAEREHAVRTSARDQAEGRHDELLALTATLEAALAAWRPAEERYRLAKRLAELAVGTSSDNRLDMRLSSYVLGERLRQVVDAANARLDHMSGGRYSLLYDVRKSAADRKRSGGGLGLRVLDGWTGVDRDPVTLSGGEAFMTSLALALALADVVTAEAGGVELGTLFIDEGFGTLDDETLDGVLDILDELRDGGRAVGIVSHVGELRARVPAQLKVTKQRFGSSLTVAVPA